VVSEDGAVKPPDTLDDIDLPWLRDAMGCSDELIAFDVQSLSDGVGFLGLTGRVRLHYAGSPTGPESVVVKLRRRADDTELMSQYWDAWAREAVFYDELAGDVVVRVPSAHHVTNRPGEFALILEDGAPAVSGDQVAGPAPGQAEVAIDAIASMHAAWWDSPRLAEPAIHRVSTTARIVGDRFEEAFPTLRHRFGGRVTEKAFEDIEWFAGEIARWRDTVDFGPPTLIHTDFRLDNLLFHPDGGVIFVDWQLFGPGRGPRDIANFICTNLDPPERRARERGLLTGWNDAFERSGGQRLDDRLLWEEYVAWVLVSTLTYAATVTALDDTNERGRALFDAMLTRALTATDDLDAASVVARQLG